MSFLKDYQKLYDNFTQRRRLDDNDFGWTDAEKAEFKAAYRRLEAQYRSPEANKSADLNDLALSRLALLPEPTDVTLDGPERYAQSAWQTTDKFTYDPDLYTEPVLAEVNLDELLGTDPNLSRKKIEAHITGKALTTNGHYALVVVKNGDKVILDGHHRLMAQWLLGNPAAQVWLVEEK
jgi:hypothetical protein